MSIIHMPKTLTFGTNIFGSAAILLHGTTSAPPMRGPIFQRPNDGCFSEVSWRVTIDRPLK